jgi:hypothetical protein
VSNANTQVGNLTGELNAILGGAGSATNAQMTSEQTTTTNLQNTFAAAQAQANQALSMIQYYSTLATTQQGLNAQQQQEYNQAILNYQQAQQTQASILKASATTSGTTGTSGTLTPVKNGTTGAPLQSLGDTGLARGLSTGLGDIGGALAKSGSIVPAALSLIRGLNL